MNENSSRPTQRKTVIHPSSTGKIPYRPHIDGLRGIAVIAVVLYHAKLFSVTGGFIGVDVFFVISGFLIASIIFHDIENGVFSLRKFWERRIRRILPILSVVTLATTAASFVIMLYPPDVSFFGKTLIAQSMFASNLLFMVSNNYFDEQAGFSPLLHIWSLSVEEQFYIFFPLLIAGILWLSQRAKQKAHTKPAMLNASKDIHATNTGNVSQISGTDPEWKKRLLIIVLTLSALSLTLNVIFVNISPSTPFRFPLIHDWLFGGATHATVGFYLLFTRAWELGVGIIAALLALRVRSDIAAEFVSFSCIVAIALTAFLLQDLAPFPGAITLIPVLATALFIIANEDRVTRTGKILSSRLAVFIGLISFSLYLWHWPIFVLLSTASLTRPSDTAMMIASIAAILLSSITYRYIETPFRTKLLTGRSTAIFVLAIAMVAAIGTLGVLITNNAAALSSRIPPSAKGVLAATSDNIRWGDICFQRNGDESLYGGLCRIGNAELGATPKFVIWGDSHAEALVPLFNILGNAYKVQGVVFDSGNCIPIIGVHQTPLNSDCEAKKASAHRFIVENDIRSIVLIARWNFYITMRQSGVEDSLITDSEKGSATNEEAAKIFVSAFTKEVTQLAREGRTIYIVEQVPEQPNFDLRGLFYRAAHTGKQIQFEGIRAQEHLVSQRIPHATIAELAQLPNVHVVDPATLLCDKKEVCEIIRDGKLLYRDESHISTLGAISLEPLFTPFFVNLMLEKK